MQRIISFSIFLFVAHQSYSQFNSMEFPRERHFVKVLQMDRLQTKQIEFDSKDVSHLIHPNAKEKSVLLASAPLDDFSLTSPFGFRPDPISGDPKFHRGIDLKSNRSKVYSMSHGKVASVGHDPLLGNFVKVQHGKYESLYGHLSKVLVSPMENVLPGSVLGISGSTGKSTGDHLHLTIKKGKDFINPALFIQMLSKITTKEELITYLYKP